MVDNNFNLKLLHLYCLFICFLCSVKCSTKNEHISLELNESCKTPNGKSAQCISIYDCRLLYEQLTSSKQSAIDFLRASDCGVHQDVPLVCCGDDVDFDDQHLPGASEIRNRTGMTFTKPGGVNLASRFGEESEGEEISFGIPNVSSRSSGVATRDECGYMAVQDRIINGVVANIDEFPWMALLRYQRKSDGNKKFLCGGSLIGNRYVLTAAHCVTGEIERTHRLIAVRLGEFNILEETDCIRVGGYVECTDPPLDVAIERVISHPHYDESRREKPNDIALLRLARDISYTYFIRPICLPTTYDVTTVGQHLTVAGWGRTESAAASAVKLKLRVPITTKRYCRNTFRQAGATIRDTQICAGGEKGRDSCTGDSGGPLMSTISPNTDQWYIEGIVSFGTTCGTKGWPGVYTKVSSYLDWINANI